MHVEQQTQFGQVAQAPAGGAVRRVEQQIGIVLGALLAAGLLVGVEPVHQPLGVGLGDVQTQQQAAELRLGGGVGLLVLHQAVEVEAPGQVLDTNLDASLLDLERRLRQCPGLGRVVDGGLRRAALAGGAQVAAQDRLRQRLAAQRVVPGLTRLQLVGGGADRELLAGDHAGADDRDDCHHEQHRDQRDAALRLHYRLPSSNGSGRPMESGWMNCAAGFGPSGRRSRRVSVP